MPIGHLPLLALDWWTNVECRNNQGVAATYLPLAHVELTGQAVPYE